MKEKDEMNVKKDNDKETNVNENLKEMKTKSRKDKRTCKIRRRNSCTRKALSTRRKNESERWNGF
jgi:hypothetical protein